tara:strand:+ start:4968 stop:5261 length:294 start_codon:yes stop_codon:yes gene_type:complete
MIINIIICVTMWAFHLLSKWLEVDTDARSKGLPRPGFFAYYQDILPTVLVSVVGTIGAFLMVLQLDWMNAGMAGACGYMGSSLAKKIVDQFQAKAGT